MSKFTRRAAFSVGVAGVLLYGTWAQFAAVQLAMILLAGGLILVIAIIHFTHNHLNPNLLVTTVAVALFAIYLNWTGEKIIGAIAVELMILGGVLFALSETIKSPAKK